MPPFHRVTSRNGRVTVSVSHLQRGEKRYYRLFWRDATGRHHSTTIADDPHDPQRPQRVAAEIAEREGAGLATPVFSRTEKAEYLRARDALSGIDITVDQVAREWAQMRLMLQGSGQTPFSVVEEVAARITASQVSIREAVDEMNADLERLGMSDRYRRDQRLTGEKLHEAFPERCLSAVTRHDLAPLLESWAGTSKAKTYNNLRGSLYTLFSWAKKRGYVVANPVEAIPKRKEKRKISAYTADDVRKILDQCPEELIPWVVLQAFGCLRSAEVCRVRWGEHIQLDRKILRASNEITKTGQTRIIPLPDNAVAWLKPYERPSGPVYLGKTEGGIGSRMRKRLAKAIKAANVEPIPNGLRKGCASHLVPVCSHIGEAAERMGHTVAEMKRSYRELRSVEEAAEWWGVFPERK